MAGSLLPFPDIGRAHQEALALLLQARDYARSRHGDREGGPVTRLVVTVEIMRVAARLAHAMAWILTRRAGEGGESAGRRHRDPPLLTVAVCTDDTSETDPRLPDDLRQLLRRSRALYMRLARLEGAPTGTAGPPAPPRRRAAATRVRPRHDR